MSFILCLYYHCCLHLLFRLQDLENVKHLRALEEIIAIEKTINDVIQSGEEKKKEDICRS